MVRMPITAAVTLLALALAAPTAMADLRSPKLESTCPAGYTYAERDVGKWRVEGCSKAGVAVGNETERWLYDGDVEASGLLIEPSVGTDDLIVTEEETTSGGDTVTTGRLKRTASTRLVVDPIIGGARREYTIYTGSIDLDAVNNDLTVTKKTGGVLVGPIARNAVALGATLEEIPTASTASVLGLRIQDDIADATVTTASVKFEIALSLGTAAPNLIDDFVNTNTIEVTLDDGSGMLLTDLTFKIKDIAIAGIGGLENFRVTYSNTSDSWSGTVKLDLGSLFPSLEFETEVSAANGALLYIRAAVDNLNIPIGSTGIVLDAVEAAFDLDPLMVEAGVGVTAGPKIAGSAIIAVTGTLKIELEPSFRLEASGTVRLLPSGNSELASGTAEFVYDADGYISMSADAYFALTVFGVGIGASIGGSGEYSTTGNLFNVEAHATGSLLLGKFGSVDIVRLEAVVSSNGWGTCGDVLLFLSAGVGQQWGEGIDLMLGCDLSPYDANVPGARAAAAQAGVPARPFMVPPGTKKLGIDVAAQPGARLRLRGPDGAIRLQTEPGMRGPAGDDAVVMAAPDGTRQFIALRNPPPGRYAVVWPADGPQVTDVSLMRDAPPLAATARVTRRPDDPAGRRRLDVRATGGLGAGETLEVGIRTRRGVRPVGRCTPPACALAFDEVEPGPHEIVAHVLRNGVPVPQRKAVIGRYTASLPARPAAVRVRQRGRRLQALATPRRGAEAPDGWAYEFRTRRGGRLLLRQTAGKPATLSLRRGTRSLAVAVRPIVGRRVLRTAALRKTIRVQRPVR